MECIAWAYCSMFYLVSIRFGYVFCSISVYFFFYTKTRKTTLDKIFT